MEALHSSETLVHTYQTICCHITEECNYSVRTCSLPVDLVTLVGHCTEKNLGHSSETRVSAAVNSLTHLRAYVAAVHMR